MKYIRQLIKDLRFVFGLMVMLLATITSAIASYILFRYALDAYGWFLFPALTSLCSVVYLYLTIIDWLLDKFGVLNE